MRNNKKHCQATQNTTGSCQSLVRKPAIVVSLQTAWFLGLNCSPKLRANTSFVLMFHSLKLEHWISSELELLFRDLSLQKAVHYIHSDPKFEIGFGWFISRFQILGLHIVSKAEYSRTQDRHFWLSCIVPRYKLRTLLTIMYYVVRVLDYLYFYMCRP